MLKYVTGDLFSHTIDPTKHTYICHVVNNIGAWGSGFVIPLAKNYPEARLEYLDDFSAYSLGENQYVHINPRLVIVNMFAQDGISNYAKSKNVKPFQYGYFTECLLQFRNSCIDYPIGDEDILMPLVGAGLGGGNWDIIEEIIENILGKSNVTIFQLPGQEVR